MKKQITTKIKNKYEKIIDFGSNCAHERRLLRTEKPVGKEGEKPNELRDAGLPRRS